MKKIVPYGYLYIALVAGCSHKAGEKESRYFADGDMVQISKSELQDKIKGGWAGQVIGCTYGGPTEFQWNGTMIGDHVPIPWDENQMLWWYENAPGLYDDVYMDLTFVQVFEEHGLDASDTLHALAFAHAEYPLWHANQAARYNILNGIMPPASGHWKNNPHADDIDIDASINGAYIVLGLLYGNGDFGKTIDISTRAGYDSDCNPANAAGILGTLLGFSNIPDYWKQGIEKVDGMNFVYTDMSPVKWEHRKHDIYWNYDLEEKDYEIKLVARELKEGIRIDVSALIIYSDTAPEAKTYY